MRTLPAIFFTLILGMGFSQNNELNTIVQRGHNETIKSVAISPNGQFLLTGSRDKSAKLWDWNTGLEIHSFLGHEHTVNQVLFNQDGTLIGTSSADNTARIWSTKSHELLWTSPKSSNYTTTIAFHPNKKWVAVGGHDWQLVVYDYSTGDSLVSIKVVPDKGVGYGVQAQFSLDGSKLLIGQDNRLVAAYDTKKWEELYKVKPAQGWCGGCGSYIANGIDGTTFTKVSNNDSVRTYDITTGQQIRVYPFKLRDMAGVSFSKDGKTILVASKDSVWVLDALTPKVIKRWHPEIKNINSATLHPDGSILLGTDDNVTFQYNTDGVQLRVFKGIQNDLDNSGNPYDQNSYWQRHIVQHIKYRPKQIYSSRDHRVIEFGSGTTAYQWSIADGKKKTIYSGHSQMIISAALSSDGKILATGSANGELFLWDYQSGKLKAKLKGHRDAIFDISFANSDNSIASSDWGGHVIVHHTADTEIHSDIYLGNVAAYEVSFTENDVYLILGKLDKTLELWEIDSKTKVKDFIGHTDIVSQIETISSNEFLTSSRDGTLVSWNLASGLINKKLYHPSGTKVHGFIYSHETKRVVTIGSDRKIYEWDLSTKKLLKSTAAHQDEITSIFNIASAQTSLLTRSIDGETKIWGKDLDLRYARIALSPTTWMATTPTGHFYGTSKAMQFIHFVNKNTVYKPEQFFNDFFDADLIKKALTGVSQKRNIFETIKKNSPPRTQLVALKNEGDSSATILLRVIHQSSYKSMALYQNNKMLGVDWKLISKKKLNDSTDQYKIPVRLVSGHNEFSAVVSIKNNMESIPNPIDVFSTNTSPGSNCYVLAIGINKYKNPKLNLNYARADASAFVDSITSNGNKLYQEIKSFELYDKNATKGNMQATLDSIIAQASINDVVIIYYAGHGSMSEGQFYFVPTNATHLYDQDDLKEEAFSAEELQTYLTRIKALKQVILIDACQSGGSVETLAMRGASEEKAIIQLSRSTGIHIFAAAESTQFAGEFSSLGHGLFTHVLLQGLSGEADGTPNDNNITVFELKSYLDQIVPDLSQKLKKTPQYPYTFSRGQDFPILTH